MKHNFFYNIDEKDNGSQQQPTEQNKITEGGSDSAGITSLDQEIIKERFGVEAQNRIRDFRTKIDTLYLSVKTLPSSRAISLAITSFQTGRQYAGLILAEKGAANPYPESTNPNSSKIEERADKGYVVGNLGDFDEIGKIKFLRALAADLVPELSIYLETNAPSSPIEFISQTKMVESVLSGKMWLGERLGEIKESENAGK